MQFCRQNWFINSSYSGSVNSQETSEPAISPEVGSSTPSNWRFWLDGTKKSESAISQVQTRAANSLRPSLVSDMIADFDGGPLTNLAIAWASANLPKAHIESMMKLATDVFEDAHFAEEWLNRPNPATDDKPPIVLVGTANGLKRVDTLINRLAYGIVA